MRGPTCTWSQISYALPMIFQRFSARCIAPPKEIESKYGERVETRASAAKQPTRRAC
jgi:hypothetical protein